MTWLLVEDVARIVQVHPRTVQRWCRDRRISHVRVGRNIRFTQEQVDEIAKSYTCDPVVTVHVDVPNPVYHQRAIVMPMESRREDGAA